MTTETLRAAIEAAFRRRDPEAEVTIASLSTPLGSVHYTASVMVLAARTAGDRSTERGALESLAVAAGLRVETCGSCGGRGQRLYAREVEDGCDECECAGVVVVDPAKEIARLDDVARGALDDLAGVRAEFDAARAVLRESEETARQASMRAEETVALLRTSIADLVPLRVAVREYLAARKSVTEVRYADESVAAHERVAAAFAMLGRLV